MQATISPVVDQGNIFPPMAWWEVEELLAEETWYLDGDFDDDGYGEVYHDQERGAVA